MVRCTWDRTDDQAAGADRSPSGGRRRRPGTTSNRCTQIDEEPVFQGARGGRRYPVSDAHQLVPARLCIGQAASGDALGWSNERRGITRAAPDGRRS
jgi:hypothetical protein